MAFSDRRIAVLLLFSLLTACLGQAVMLSAAPHPRSLRSLSHSVGHRLAAGLQRHFHGRADSTIIVKTRV